MGARSAVSIPEGARESGCSGGILAAGLPLFPPNGIPVYIAHFPTQLLAKMPQPASTAAGIDAVRGNLDAGADATKLFIATPQGRGVIRRMPADIARAASEESHRRGRMVLAHPTDIEGVRQSLAAGSGPTSAT